MRQSAERTVPEKFILFFPGHILFAQKGVSQGSVILHGVLIVDGGPSGLGTEDPHRRQRNFYEICLIKEQKKTSWIWRKLED